MILPLFIKKFSYQWNNRRNRLNPYSGFPNEGFTILEIMVAMAIMGIAISIFFSLIGSSSKLRGRVDEHAKLVFLARTKTEEAFLGLFEKNYTSMDEKKIFEGKTKDGIQWKVTENSKKDVNEVRKINTGPMFLSKENKNDVVSPLPQGVVLISTQIGVITIDTAFISDDESAPDKSMLEDEKEKRKSIRDDLE